MPDRKKKNESDSTHQNADLTEALADPETMAFLKDYLAISDEELKAHVRRLVEEIRANRKKDAKG
jgi:hypothetical protein